MWQHKQLHKRKRIYVLGLPLKCIRIQKSRVWDRISLKLLYFKNSILTHIPGISPLLLKHFHKYFDISFFPSSKWWLPIYCMYTLVIGYSSLICSPWRIALMKCQLPMLILQSIVIPDVKSIEFLLLRSLFFRL